MKENKTIYSVLVQILNGMFLLSPFIFVIWNSQGWYLPKKTIFGFAPGGIEIFLACCSLAGFSFFYFILKYKTILTQRFPHITKTHIALFMVVTLILIRLVKYILSMSGS